MSMQFQNSRAVYFCDGCSDVAVTVPRIANGTFPEGWYGRDVEKRDTVFACSAGCRRDVDLVHGPSQRIPMTWYRDEYTAGDRYPRRRALTRDGGEEPKPTEFVTPEVAPAPVDRDDPTVKVPAPPEPSVDKTPARRTPARKAPKKGPKKGRGR